MTGIKFLSDNTCWRSALRILIAGILISPFLIWLLKMPSWGAIGFETFGGIQWLGMIVQALLSTGISLLLGVLLVLSLQSWRREYQDIVELILLSPNLIPALFLALGLLNLNSIVGSGLRGFWLVVIAHVILNAGLVAVGMHRLIVQRTEGLVEAAWLTGASKSVIWIRVVLPLLRAELVCLTLFVFSICFTSFSLPLLLSRTRPMTLEVAIFDAIRVWGRWDQAIILAGVQSGFLLVLAWLLPRSFWPPKVSRQSSSILGVRALRGLAVMPLLILIMGWGVGLLRSFSVAWPADLISNLWPTMLMTAALGLSVGLIHLVIFLLIALVGPSSRLNYFLNGYLAPSPVITGFAMLFVPGRDSAASFLKLVVALSLISLPLIYRWVVHATLSGLYQQMTVARLMGASWWVILLEIIWPQAASTILNACGVAAIWASGDFALSAILLGTNTTLPMMIDGLIGGYRLEIAQVLLLPLALVSGGLYMFFVGMGRYVSR